jgi:hypothetical protein
MCRVRVVMDIFATLFDRVGDGGLLTTIEDLAEVGPQLL